MTDIDGTTLARGVLLALAMIDNLPEGQRRDGERDDLVHLLCLLVQDPAERELLVREVEVQTGQGIDVTDWQGREWRL